MTSTTRMGNILTAIVDAVDEPTAQAVATAVSRLTSRGEIREGDRLPTIRDLADALGVSPTTVADAWRILSSRGLIVTRRRGGTVSAGMPQHHVGSDFYTEKDALARRGVQVNLISGSPDPHLLPDLSLVFADALAGYEPIGYLSREILPALEDAVLQTWPFPTDRLLLAHGTADALERVIQTTIQFGDRVLVEEHAFPPLLDVLRTAGADLVPLSLDEDGIVPDSLEKALGVDPVALFLTPRAQNPTGIDMSEERCRELATVLSGTDVLVVEDDYLSTASHAALHSIGSMRPERLVHIRGFSKAFGPDLRVAALSGPDEILDRIRRRQRLGPAWVSAVIQRILLALVTTPSVTSVVESAAVTYRERRESLVTRLRARGVALPSGGRGYHRWLPVMDESEALSTLATHGITVSRGTSFRASTAGPSGLDHIRVTISEILPDSVHLATRLADACQTPPTMPGARVCGVTRLE